MGCQPLSGVGTCHHQESPLRSQIVELQLLANVIPLQVLGQRPAIHPRSVDPEPLVAAKQPSPEQHPASGIGEKPRGSLAAKHRLQGGGGERINKLHRIATTHKERRPPAQIGPGDRPPQTLIPRRRHGRGSGDRLDAHRILARLSRGIHSPRGVIQKKCWSRVNARERSSVLSSTATCETARPRGGKQGSRR